MNRYCNMYWYFGRYCNSHLQVLGFIPKKERKKKQDALDEVRARAHVESVALNITVPSLALRDTNGLDGLPPSPPCSRLTPMPLSDSDLLDPFAFYEEDTDGEDSVVQKRFSKRKLLSRPVIGLRVTTWDPEHHQPDIEHFGSVTEPCTLPTSPHLPQPPPPPTPPPLQPSARLVQPPQQTDRPAYAQHGAVQTLLCKPAPPQTGPSVLSGLLPSAGVQNQPVSRRPVPAASPMYICCPGLPTAPRRGHAPHCLYSTPCLPAQTTAPCAALQLRDREITEICSHILVRTTCYN